MFTRPCEYHSRLSYLLKFSSMEKLNVGLKDRSATIPYIHTKFTIICAKYRDKLGVKISNKRVWYQRFQ